MHFPKTTICGVALTGLIALGGLVGCSTSPASPHASDTAGEPFALGHLNSTAHVLAFVAQEEGYFADEGLDVSLVQLSSGTEMVSALEAGKLDAAFIGSVPAIVAQSNGHDVSIFGGAMSNGHGYVIDPKHTKGLDEWDVTILRGKTVAVPRTTVQEAELLQILDHYGLTYAEDDSADVRLVYFDSQKDAYAALASPEIDAASCYSPYTAIAVDDGYSIVYRCSDEDLFQNQPCCRQVALTERLEADPDVYEAFERALIRAYAFTQDNHDQTVSDVRRYIDIPDAQIAFELYEGYATSSPDPDKQATANLKDDIVAFGYTADYDIEPLYDIGIYDRALAAVEAENPSGEWYRQLRAHFDENE